VIELPKLKDEDGLEVDFGRFGGTNEITKKLPAQLPRDPATEKFKSNV